MHESAAILHRAIRPAIAIGFLIGLAGCSDPGKRSKPLDGPALYALIAPSVFKVSPMGEYNFRDFRVRTNPATFPAIASSSECWTELAANPDVYLEVSIASPALTDVRHLYKYGTAFAVSEDGVLLTNAHVVTKPDLSLPNEYMAPLADPLMRITRHAPPKSLWGASLLKESPYLDPYPGRFGSSAPPPLQQNFAAVEPAVCAVNFPPGDESRGRWIIGMSRWLAGKGVIESTSPVREVEIASNYSAAGLTTLIPYPYGMEARREPTARILKSGQPTPGPDVAVLRVQAKRKWIAIPLGDSSEKALPIGSRIWSFGFPGVVGQMGLVQDEAHPKVLIHTGQLTQRFKTDPSAQWEALYMDVPISHGDSGGPLVDQYGRAIGLNAAGSTEVSGNNLAEPIDLAKSYLDLARVQAHAGSITNYWYRGQMSLQRGDCADALTDFKIVAGDLPNPGERSEMGLWQRLKSSWGSQPMLPRDLIPPFRNDYVDAAIKTCETGSRPR